MVTTAPPAPFRLLLVEDEEQNAKLLQQMVESGRGRLFQVAAHAATLEEAIAQVSRQNFDAVLLDLWLPDSRGLNTFAKLHSAALHLPIILLTGVDDEEMALEAIHQGAQEYLVKSATDGHALRRAVRYAIERSRAEAELARERDLLKTLLENIPDRIYFKDRQSRFTRINHALTELFHLSCPEEAYGKTDADFYGGEHAQEALDDERRVMETGQPVINKIEYEVMTNGRKSWSLTSKLPLVDADGHTLGTCGISREITALKEMEEQLGAERNVLRAVVDNVPDFIFLKDQEGRYLLGNAAHLRWLGLHDPTEVVGKSVFDFFPQEVAEHLHADDLQVLSSGVALVNHEERLLDRTGEMRWVLTTKVPWRGEGTEVLGLVCIARDVTLQKRAEESLRKAYAELAYSREEVLAGMEKLQAAHQQLRSVQLQLIEAEKMKSIGRLAAGVAHEVKNPLSILKMGLDFLKTVSIPDDSASMILHEMNEAVQRADTVIRGLLDFSAPRQLEAHPVDLNKIIESTLKMVRGEMKAAYQVEKELQPSLPPLGLDAAKISQVFINLFTNALHAMNHGGLLRVRTYTRQLTGVGSNIASSQSEAFRGVGQRIVVCEIDDSGCGIPDEKLGKVFEPFYTTKPTGTGTGLGLSVVKTIIDLHGATIDLINRPEGGVRVTIMFQVGAPAPTPSASASIPQPA